MKYSEQIRMLKSMQTEMLRNKAAILGLGTQIDIYREPVASDNLRSLISDIGATIYSLNDVIENLPNPNKEE